MEAALQLLLNLIVAPLNDVNARAVLVPRPELTLLALGEFVDQPTAAAIHTLLHDISQGMAVARAFTQLQQFAEQITQAIADIPDSGSRLERAAQQLGLFHAINQQPRAGRTIRHIHASLDERAFSTIVAEWHIQNARAEHETVVINRVVASEQPIIFRPRGTSYIERHIALHYRPNVNHPIIELRAPSATATEAVPCTRPAWRQPAHPDYDLLVYTEQKRFKGTVVTRAFDLPLVIEGQLITLTVPGTNTRVIATDIYDSQETLLTRVFCWPPMPERGS